MSYGFKSLFLGVPLTPPNLIYKEEYEERVATSFPKHSSLRIYQHLHANLKNITNNEMFCILLKLLLLDNEVLECSGFLFEEFVSLFLFDVLFYTSGKTWATIGEPYADGKHYSVCY